MLSPTPFLTPLPSAVWATWRDMWWTTWMTKQCTKIADSPWRLRVDYCQQHCALHSATSREAGLAWGTLHFARSSRSLLFPRNCGWPTILTSYNATSSSSFVNWSQLTLVLFCLQMVPEPAPTNSGKKPGQIKCKRAARTTIMKKLKLRGHYDIGTALWTLDLHKYSVDTTVNCLSTCMCIIFCFCVLFRASVIPIFIDLFLCSAYNSGWEPGWGKAQ